MTAATTAPGPALVLGGHGDIGSAIARRLAEAGHSVVVAGRRDIDLSDTASIDAFFERDGTPFQVVVHSAGLNRPKPFLELGMEEIEEALRVNLTGFLRCMKHLGPGMVERRNGRVLVISSLYGFIGRRGRIPYVMAKHALMGAVRTLAIEFGSAGILVNGLSPGYVDTKMTRANNDDATIRKFESLIPLGCLAAPEDIAEVANFLCSPSNRYVTGQDIVVDGGFSVGGFNG